MTGHATAWNPNPNRGITSFAVKGSTLYVAGGFTNIGGQNSNREQQRWMWRNGVSLPHQWDPNANNSVVNVIAVNGGVIYAGGDFTNIGGQNRNFIAALDAGTGAATPWDPNGNNIVNAIAVNGSVVLCRRIFLSYRRSQSEFSCRITDATTGAATSWNPNPNQAVGALDVNGVISYGVFREAIRGQSRSALAALDATTGAATSWDPGIIHFVDQGVVSNIDALATNGNMLYIGGAFFTINGGETRPGFAQFSIPLPAPTISSIAPMSGPTAGGTSVTITGTTSFVGTPAVSVGGALAAQITFVNSTTLTAKTPAGTAGAKNIIVTNPDGQPSNTFIGGFTYVPAPTVTSLAPTSGPVAGGTSVTITGTNFINSPTITIGGVPVYTTCFREQHDTDRKDTSWSRRSTKRDCHQSP